MAGITSRISRNVRCWLAWRSCPGTSVTGCTGTRCATEDTGRVAGFAIDQLVGVIEDVTSSVVIKTQVLRPIGLRLRESTAPLPEQESSGGQRDKKETGKVVHRQSTS